MTAVSTTRFLTYFDTKNTRLLVVDGIEGTSLMDLHAFLDGEVIPVEPHDHVVAGSMMTIRELVALDELLAKNPNAVHRRFARVAVTRWDQFTPLFDVDEDTTRRVAMRIRDAHPELVDESGVFDVRAYVKLIGGTELPIDLEHHGHYELTIRSIGDFDFTTTVFGTRARDTHVVAKAIYVHEVLYPQNHDEYHPMFLDVHTSDITDTCFATFANTLIRGPRDTQETPS